MNLIGQRFGKLVVTEDGGVKKLKNGNPCRLWKCKCDCGGEALVPTAKLRNGHTKSCGCMVRQNKGSHFEDLTGQRFGRLTVVRWLRNDERKARQYNWLCRCDCGNEIQSTANKLKTGTQVSCGCRKHEHAVEFGQINRKYAIVNKRLYGVYKMMIDRCCNQQSENYQSYGGRGITVCDEWQGEDGYDNFAKWAYDNEYDPNAKQGECTLDRIDVNGNYTPDNCRWVDSITQANNKRDNIWITHNDESHTIAEWSRILDIPYGFLNWRLTKASRIRTLQECIEEYHKV